MAEKTWFRTIKNQKQKIFMNRKFYILSADFFQDHPKKSYQKEKFPIFFSKLK